MTDAASLICTTCGGESPGGARFCMHCAAPLPLGCVSCGAELRPTAKFCDECAAPTGASPRATPLPNASAAEPADTRKVVTIVFADLVGSTALHERLEPESARRFMESYYVAMRGAVESHGGTVTQLLGDGVKAVFGIPRVAEDDAIRAVRAAAAMQESFRALAEEQRGAVGATGLRVAVNTGEVVANDETEIIGDPVNVAARLQEQGRDGDVVVGESTHQLVSTLVTLELLGSFALKGRSEAVRAYRVVSLDRPVGAATAAFVGRDEELARLDTVYQAAVEKPAAGLAVLVGSPGLGKSRLIDEFAHRSGEAATVVRARCDAEGGASFSPLAVALRELLGIEGSANADALRTAIEAVLSAEEPDRGRIAAGVAALLAGSPASPEETFFVVRRLLGALARTRPVVLVIDDLHWAEPLLLDLVEHLIQWGSGVPLFVLVGARPELRDLRSSLVTPGGLVSDVLALGGLDAGAATRLAANVIGAADLPAAVAAKVLATSEGNPLFVSELVRMLVQEGALTREGERWTVGANLAALEMPPTIHALLAARIERLQPEERWVLERAAVVGRNFSRSAVAALLPREAGDLDARLEALRRSELIERDSGWLLGEPVLRFHHLLIRDAAYRRLLKGTRAELHAKLADWIEARVGDAPEHDEMIGWHLEQAHAFLRELGPLDENAKRLGERAAVRLSAAGRRALGGDDVPLAASLLGRALDGLDPDDASRAELALDWCEALLAAGDVVEASSAIDELGRFCGAEPGGAESGASASADTERLRAWHTCFIGQHTVLTAPEALQGTADTVAAAAESLARLGDAAGEAKAHFVYALALSRLGKIGACEAALDRALAAARRVAGDRRRANTVLAIAPLAALWGPSPVTRASGRCLDVVRVLRITQGAPAVEAVALSCQGVLEALRGRTDAAGRMIASARKMVEELGITQRLLEVDVFGGLVELYEGDAVAAERTLRQAYQGMRELGLGVDAARAAALLARALLAQDRVGEAEVLSHESEALAGDDLKAAIAWRGARAEALARRGEHAAAVEFASRAVEIAAATDALLDHADARLALAAALRAAGRGREADAEEQRAHELWKAKGATLLAERARRDGAGEAPAATRSEDATAPQAGALAEHRRVRPNVATAANERLLDSRDPHYELETLATLGSSLALSRRRYGSSGDARGRYDVGAYENETLQLIEVDERGLGVRSEDFAAERLGDAVNRLYEWYAERLPEGPERARAETAAEALVSMMNISSDVERLGAELSPDIECIDHRHLSLWSARGAEAFLEHRRALLQVAENIAFVQEEILALQPGAVLMRVMHSGTEREGGGAYERPFLSIFMTDAQGRIARVEWFAADCEAEALARFDELAAGGASQLRVQRRVRTNAASAAQTRMAAALAARDFEAMEAVLGEDLEATDHRWHARYGRDGVLETCRRMAQPHDADFVTEPIATFGEWLSLCRSSVRASGASGRNFDVGEHATEYLELAEVDRSGRIQGFEFFGADRLTDALVRLYERHAEGIPEGPERERAAATARSVAVWSGPIDLDRLATAVTPSVANVDHRVLGTWSARGAEEFLRHWREQQELTVGWALRDEDVLAVDAHAFVVRRTYYGTGRDTGGAFENRVLSLWRFGADGLLASVEVWEPDQEAEALARFDACTGGGEDLEHPFANAASRANRRRADAFNARDWAGIEACVSPDLVFDERRRMLRNTADREGWRAQTRLLFEVPDGRFTLELRATRGERLSLHVHHFEGTVAGGGGPLALDPHLALHEVDADGRIVATVLFDLEDEEAAYAELDARFEAGEAQSCPLVRRSLATSRLLHTRDWQGYAAGISPDFVYRDHRLLGWGDTGHDSEALVRMVRSAFDLSPDARYRDDHIRIAARGALRQAALVGTRDGGAFENPMYIVFEVDEQGRNAETDSYDVADRDRALARFAELAAPAPGPAESRFANAATRTIERASAALGARNWEGFGALFAADFRQIDRRAIAHVETDREEFLRSHREIVEITSRRPVPTFLATRGERLALVRMLWEGAEGDVGPSEIDWLLLIEVDASGDHSLVIAFEPDDLDGAYAELDARWEAGEDAEQAAGVAFVRAFNAGLARRDWGAIAACYVPEFVGDDHRLVSWGTLRGPVAFVAAFRTMIDLAPDAELRWDHLRTSRRGVLAEAVWMGTRDGGAFESPLVLVGELDPLGRAERVDFYDPHHLDRALARFEEVRANEAGDPPAALAKSNAASEWLHRFEPAFNARDWDAIRDLFAVEAVYDDRQRFSRVSGGLDVVLSSVRERAEAGARLERIDLLGTAGDRVAVQRLLWAGGGAGDRFEMEFVVVQEVDEAGRLVATINFDPGDERAAQREAWARWAAIEPHTAGVTTALGGLVDAFNAHDREGWRAQLADDVVVLDHRRTGFGRLEGADAYADSLTALWELAPETEVEAGWHWLAHDRHGGIAIVRRTGVIPDGGDFESEYLNCLVVSDGRVSHSELFEVDAAAAALARFEALRPDPLRIPPNAATRALEPIAQLLADGDVAALRACATGDFCFDDRSRRAQLRGGVEEWIGALRFLRTEIRGQFDSRLLATAGDRLALHSVAWQEPAGESPFLIESFRLTEVDATGKLRALVLFDPDEGAAARTELFERWAAGGADGVPAAVIEFQRALNDHDLPRVRAALSADFVLNDHRRTGLGRIEDVDAYVASVAAVFELSPDARWDTLYRAASGPHGLVHVNCMSGKNAEGGDFESPFVALYRYRGDQFPDGEMFEVEDLDAALARFEALRVEWEAGR